MSGRRQPRVRGLLIASLCMLALGSPVTESYAQRGPQFAGQPRIKALMVAGGCCHDYPAQAAIFMRQLHEELPIDWTFQYLNWQANREAPAFYSDPNWFQGYDIVVHNDCFTPPDSLLSEEYLSNAAAANRAGIPAVVIHCAMHTFRDASTDQWRGMLGVASSHHTPSHNIAIEILEPEHPIMAGIESGWVTPIDELYVVDRVFPGVFPLASGNDPADGKEHVVAWVHENGARVFGTTLGHGMDTWHDPVFQQLIVQGFRWALEK